MSGKLNIHRIQFSNFHTFLEKAEVSFVLESKDVDACQGFASRAVENVYLSPAVTIAGSDDGCANSIKPLMFVADFLSSGCGEGKRVCGLRTHPSSKGRRGKIGLEFELNENFYRYALEFLNNKVVFESLHVRKGRRFASIFVREVYGRLNDVKTTGFGISGEALKNARLNGSLIPFAAELGSPLANELVAAFSVVAASKNWSSPSDILPADVTAAAEFFARNDSLRKQMSSFFAGINIGFDDIFLKRKEFIVGCGLAKELYVPYGIRFTDLDKASQSVRPLWVENRDILTIFVQLSRLLPVLNEGGVAIMDRFDDGISGKVFPDLIDLFLKQDSNPHGAQLLFTAKSLDVLKCMRASQIYLIKGQTRH